MNSKSHCATIYFAFLCAPFSEAERESAARGAAIHAKVKDMLGWFQRMMIGRNGMDALNRFLSVVLLVVVAVEMLLRSRIASSVLAMLTLALIIVIYFRMFSRNLYRRGQENGAYLRLRYPVWNAIDGWRDRFRQRRDYRFFRCPSCRVWLRVPRGKGQINIVCRKCGTAFRRRT